VRLLLARFCRFVTFRYRCGGVGRLTVEFVIAS
jgi:hypothetical protein